MNALIQLNKLPETRSEQKTFVHQAIEELMNGEYDIAKFWVQATIIADTLNEIKDSTLIKKLAIVEAAKYKGQSFMGCSVDVQIRKTFNFNQCNYSVYADLKKREAELKAEIKSVETFLKSIKDVPIVDMNTGEEITAAPFIITEYITVK